MAAGKRLTALGIERTKAKGRDVWLSDDDGTRGGGRLAVRLGASGSKLFYYRYAVAGDRRAIPIGPFSVDAKPGHFTLEQAREQAREFAALHRSLPDGDVLAHLERVRQAEVDAEAAKAAASALAAEELANASKYSLVALCEAYVAHLKAAEKESAGNAGSLVRRHVAGSEWAALPAKTFTPKQATTLLRKIVESGAGRTAAKVRSVLHAAFNLALRAESDPLAPAGLIPFGIEVNPIASTAALSKFNKTRDRNLAYSELGAVWRALQPTDDERLAVKAMRLTLRLGGQRAQQLLRVRRVEDIDLESGLITIYDRKGRRPTPRPHVLPLTDQAMEDVRALIERSAALESEWLFASGKSKLGSDGLSDLAKELSDRFVAEGTCQQRFQFSDLRRTAETLLASLKVSKDTRAQLQSHGLSGVQARHYDRYEYMDEKSDALELWERYLTSAARGEELPSNVRRLKKAA